MAESPDESSSHPLRINEPDRLGDRFDGLIVLLDTCFRRFRSQPFNCFSRGLSSLGQEYPSELARTQAGGFRQCAAGMEPPTAMAPGRPPTQAVRAGRWLLTLSWLR